MIDLSKYWPGLGTDRGRGRSGSDSNAWNVKYKPGSVRLFIKPYCPWCHEARDWLDRHGIVYQALDVIRDGRAREEMRRLSGQTLAPVIDVGGRILADFGARELARFWERLGESVKVA